MLRFADAVAFARISNHHGFSPDVLQRDIELFRLGNRHVVVVLAVHQHRRCVRVGDMAQRRPRQQRVHQVALVRIHAPFHRFVLVVVGHVVVADDVRNGRGWNRRLEDVGLRDQPCGELTSVARPLHAHPIAIDPRIAANRGADAVQHVLAFVAVLVGEHGVGEDLAVTGRAAVVHHQRRPAARRVHLVLEIERRSLLAVRPAVNVDNQRILAGRAHADRLGQNGFHFELVVVRDEREGFHLAEPLRSENRCVQIGQLPRCRRSVDHVQLRQIRRAGEGIGDRVLRDRERADSALISDDTLRRAALTGIR